MARWSSYGRLDSQLQSEGDMQFLGIDMKHDRGLLDRGMLANAQNKRLRRGIAETRPGTIMPGDFNPTFVKDMAGAGIYSNPNGEEVMLAGEHSQRYVWSLQYGLAPTQIPIQYPDTVPPDRPCEFVQAFDKILMLRTGLYRPLVWDGVDPAGFTYVKKSDPGDPTTDLIPNCWYGEAFQDRVLYWSFVGDSIGDEIIMSDVLDYTSYDPILGVFRINSGQADNIIRVFGYLQGSVLVFMERSIHLLSNFTIDPSLADQQIVNSSIGLVARNAVVQVGADVFFLSQPGGIYRIGEVIQDRLQTSPVPVSDPIQPIIDRINWSFAFRSSAAILGEYVYFMVPIDGHVSPNVLLVYNTVSGRWESIDIWGNNLSYAQSMTIYKLLVTFYNGSRRLFGWQPFSPTVGLNERAIYLLHEGLNDQVKSGSYNITDLIETRGYGNESGGGPASVKKFRAVTIGLQTNNPSVTLTAIADGYNEEKAVATITKDPTKFYIHAHPDYPASGDPNEAKRQDYSTGFSEFAPQDFETLAEGAITSLPSTTGSETGVIKQQSLERKALRLTSRWVSLRVTNTQGACDVLGVAVDSIETEGVTRVAA